MTTIEESFELPSGLVLKNRLCKAAMTEGLANEFGHATPELANLYSTWAEKSDVGLLITGNVQVDRRFLERPGNVCIDLDFGEQTKEQLDALKKYAEAGKKNGAKIFMQISHGGRQSTPLVAKTVPSPSAVTMNSAFPAAEAFEMSQEQINRVIEKFIYAAKTARETGFNGVEIHAAHGYLLSSFLNPLVNQRTDEFGGALENRVRALIEIIEGIKKSQPADSDFSIAVKLNSADFQRGGFTVEEAIKVASMLAEKGIHLLELSGGNYESPVMLASGSDAEKPKAKKGSATQPKSSQRREAYFLEFAEKILKDLKEKNYNMPVLVTGGFRSRSAMDYALQSGATNLVGIGRPLCVDPSCTARLLKKEVDELPRLESAWSLPWLLGLNFLKRFKTIAKLTFFATHMTLYQNLIDMGNGDFKPQSNSKYPNLLQRMRSRSKEEAKKAADLRGFNSEDPYLLDSIRLASA